MKRKSFQQFILFCLLISWLSSLSAGTRRYRLSWADDPATSISIAFEFHLGRQAYVAYDTKPGGVDISAYQFRANPTKTQLAKGMRTCFVRLSGLQPETVYHFIVVDDQGVSRPMSFETPPNRLDRKLSIIAGGDSRNHREARQNANRVVSRLRPHAILFSGDMTNDDSPKEWAAWLDDWQLTISKDGRCYPIIPARGNHEQSNGSISEMFDVPNSDVFYALNLGGGLLRAYTLNTMVPATGPQLNWLESDLQRNPNVIWKVAQYHNAMRPHTKAKQERDDLHKFWAPVFFRHGVKLAIESDAHVVKQTWPIRPGTGPDSEMGFIRDDAQGTVYVGEGCWGAPLRSNDDPKSWTRASGRFNQFKWLWVDANKIEVRTIMTDRSSNCAAVLASNRFAIPRGLALWEPKSGAVLKITKGGRNDGVAAAPGRRPPPRTRPQPEFNPGGSNQSRRPVNPNPPGAAVPVSEMEIRPNKDGKVQLKYAVANAGPIELIIITDKMRQFYKGNLPAKGPGPYREWVQIPEIPRGVKWRLILKSRGKVIGKFSLIN